MSITYTIFLEKVLLLTEYSRKPTLSVNVSVNDFFLLQTNYGIFPAHDCDCPKCSWVCPRCNCIFHEYGCSCFKYDFIRPK